jgi:plasmid stabilization system protein ParE
VKRGVTLRWSRRAERDLEAIGDYIAADDPSAARAWVERLRVRARLAAATPLAGRIVPEVRRADVREVFVRTYLILYRVERRGILILAVFEGHRRLPGGLG